MELPYELIKEPYWLGLVRNLTLMHNQDQAPFTFLLCWCEKNFSVTFSTFVCIQLIFSINFQVQDSEQSLFWGLEDRRLLLIIFSLNVSINFYVTNKQKNRTLQLIEVMIAQKDHFYPRLNQYESHRKNN